MTTLLVGDVGGTHARFAMAKAVAGRPIRLETVRHLAVAEHGSLEEALAAYLAGIDGPAATAATIAVAGAVEPGPFVLTNSGWMVDRAGLASRLGLQDVMLLNDFEAVAHLVSQADWQSLAPLAGPAVSIPHGPVTVLGPGTGLGVALVLPDGSVVATEGGHVGFAPADDAEDALLQALRVRFGRVSVERLASGPGLAALVEAMGHPGPHRDAELWTAALAGEAPIAAALDRWLAILGGVAGDLVLAHGSGGLVLAGSLVARLGDRLGRDPFLAAFHRKGRFASRMAAISIRRLDHPEPGLSGAACAWLAASSGRVETHGS